MTQGHFLTIIKIAQFSMLAGAMNGCGLFNIELDVDQDYKSDSRSASAPTRPIVLSPSTVASPTNGSNAVVTLLRYSRFITELSEAELRDEFVKIDVANRVEYSNRGALKMIVLLSLPKATFYNEEKAEKLLNEFIGDRKSNTPALREYAHLLLSHLKQRESQFKLNEELNTKLQIERDQRKKLQRKLDDLQIIEKSITKRQKEAGG